MENLSQREATRRFPRLRPIIEALRETHREVRVVDGGEVGRRTIRETTRRGKVSVEFKLLTSQGFMDVLEGEKLRDVARRAPQDHPPTHAVRIASARRFSKNREMIPVATVAVYAIGTHL